MSSLLSATPSPFPHILPLVAGGVLGATAGMAINAIDTCPDYGSSSSRIKDIKIYMIISLIISLLFFIYAFEGTIRYFFFKGSAPSL